MHHPIFYATVLACLHFCLSHGACLWCNHDNIDHVQSHRPKRQSLLNLFGKGDTYDLKTDAKTGNNSPVIIGEPGKSSNPKPNSWLKGLGDRAGQIADSVTAIATAPGNWISHIQKHWLVYLICMTIIMIVIAFFYCSCQSKLGQCASNKNYEPLALIKMLTQQRAVPPPESV